MRNYPRLDVSTFGRHLIESGDLDPVYIALPRAVQDEEQLHRWLIAYWCYYSCGFASYASEHRGDEFWKVLMTAAENIVPAPTGGRWPRGHERRHARGAQGIKMVKGLEQRYGCVPEDIVGYVVENAPSYEGVANRVREHTLFGPWISFKVCDMVDRVLGIHMDFSEAVVFMFDDPAKAALMLWRQHFQLPESARPKDQAAVIHGVVENLKETFKDLKAPPLFDRNIDLQEVETVLCKWKSHMNGHYPLNNDIVKIASSLGEWAPHSSCAAAMQRAMPKEK